MYYLKLCVVVGFVFFVSACNNKKTKRIGRYFIKAHFINDTIIDGFAEYFNDENLLVSDARYKEGLKDGPAKNYYPTGSLKDSLNYKGGELNGWQFTYDSSGALSMRKFCYYGLSVGAHYYYSKSLLVGYLFTDFDKKELFSCTYDALLNCKLDTVDLSPSFTISANGEKDTSLEVFMYFPNPPKLTVTTTIGLISENQERKNEKLINSDRLFLDTALIYPEDKWKYYVSYNVQDSKNSINKIYFYLLHP